MSDYLSPLVANTPDLREHFKHIWSRQQPQSFGHQVYSDWADKSEEWCPWRECGFWTRDEAAILYHCAKQSDGFWLDIGAHTGWTTAHAAAAGPLVIAVDPILKNQVFHARFEENTDHCFVNLASLWPEPSDVFFRFFRDRLPVHLRDVPIGGACIDGEHDWHQPLKDAQNIVRALNSTGVVVLHDFIGGPVREAVSWLLDNGFKARIYFTPFMVAVCWRGDFTPPDHTPDPTLPDLRARCPDFDFSRCE